MKKAASTLRCSLFDLEELLRIDEKMLISNEPLTTEEIELLRLKAEEGIALHAFYYGVYFHLYEHDKEKAEEWWNKFFYHATGFGLWRASNVFAHFGGHYQEWSMRCLRRSAWKQFKLAKMKLSSLKEHPSKLLEE